MHANGVGKSNILMRYTDDAFNFKTTITIGIDCKAKMSDIDCKPLNIYLIDTAGQSRYSNITKNCFAGASGVVIVYLITSRFVFECG